MTTFADDLFTRRLHLRRAEAGDQPLLTAWLAQVDCLQGHPLLDWVRAGELWHGRLRSFVLSRHGGRPLGLLQYWLAEQRSQAAMVLPYIGRIEERGKGYGGEALHCLMLHLFNRRDVERAELWASADDAALPRCLAKLDFVLSQTWPQQSQDLLRLHRRFSLSREQFARSPVYQPPA